jgi:hypothetical protein
VRVKSLHDRGVGVAVVGFVEWGGFGHVCFGWLFLDRGCGRFLIGKGRGEVQWNVMREPVLAGNLVGKKYLFVVLR